MTSESISANNHPFGLIFILTVTRILFQVRLAKGLQLAYDLTLHSNRLAKYLFWDEPNSGLDPYTAILIDNLLQELTHEYQMTTVINTHDMNSLMQIGERILFIKEGCMAWSGVNSEVFKSATKQALEDFKGKKIKIGRARMFEDKTKELDDPGMYALNKLSQAF